MKTGRLAQAAGLMQDSAALFGVALEPGVEAQPRAARCVDHSMLVHRLLPAALVALAALATPAAHAAPATASGTVLVSEDTDYPSAGTPVPGYEPPNPAVGSFIYALDLATGARRPLYQSLAGDPSDPDGVNRSYAALGSIDRSPRTGQIVSQVNASSFGVLRDNGTDLRRLPAGLGSMAARGGGDEARPQWSPDGRRFAFIGYLSPTKGPLRLGVLVVRADGSGLRHLPLPRDGSNVGAVDWSARGELAYADDSGIVRVSPNLRTRTRIARIRDAETIGSLAWSPSGRTLAYARSQPTGPEPLFDRNNRLITVRRDGKRARTVVRSRRDSLMEFGRYPIAWAPNSTRLLFGAIDRPQNRRASERLATVSTRGGATRTVLRRDAYSPDGVIIQPAIKGYAWIVDR